MAEAIYIGRERDITKIPKSLLGKRIVDLSCYTQILQKLGVKLYTDIRGEEGNWETLAEELGIITYNEVENIHRHASLEKVFPGSVLLKRWGDSEGSTVYVLLQALRKIGREDCVEDVCKSLDDENTMELHYSIEDASGVKEFQTVKTKKDSTLGASLENALQGLVCFIIIGPDSSITWNTLAATLKGRQLSLKKVPFDPDLYNSLYGHHGLPGQQHQVTWDVSRMYPMFPTNIPITEAPFQFVNTTHSTTIPTQSPFQASERQERRSSETQVKSVNSLPNIDDSSSLTHPKCLASVDQCPSHPVLRHSKSIEDSNFHSQTDVKKYEKNIPVSCDQDDGACLKKSNSLSDLFYDTDLLKKSSSVTSMDTTELNPGCPEFSCGAEKCTHGLVWQDGQIQSMHGSCHDQLNTSKDSFMDTRDSLEICTPPGHCSPNEQDYVPHTNIVSLRKTSDSSGGSPCSPLQSPSKGATEQQLAAHNPAIPQPKPGENQSLLRTALRRSFEKKNAETAPTPKPCKKSPVHSQQNDMYFNTGAEVDTCISDTEDPIQNIEEELSKRPPQCRLPVATDGYIPMESHGAGSESRPSSLPLEATYMNMKGSPGHIARRPLPPRPVDVHPYSVTNIIESRSMGDMVAFSSNNQYTYISSDDQTPSPSSSSDPPKPPPIKKRQNKSSGNITRSQSTSAIPDLSKVPGWCASITEDNVQTMMNKYKNEDGNFMVWRMRNNTFVITVSHLRDLRHYAIHSRYIDGEIHYYIFNGGFMSTSVHDLLHHYQKEGLKGPDPVMLDGCHGKKWQKFSHVKLKHPMKSRANQKKDGN